MLLHRDSEKAARSSLILMEQGLLQQNSHKVI